MTLAINHAQTLFERLTGPFNEGANVARCDFDGSIERLVVRYGRQELGDCGNSLSITTVDARTVFNFMYNALSRDASHGAFRETQRQTAKIRGNLGGIPVDLEFHSVPRANGFTVLLAQIPTDTILLEREVKTVEREIALSIRVRITSNGKTSVLEPGNLEKSIEHLCGFPAVGNKVAIEVEYFESTSGAD